MKFERIEKYSSSSSIVVVVVVVVVSVSVRKVSLSGSWGGEG